MNYFPKISILLLSIALSACSGPKELLVKTDDIDSYDDFEVLDTLNIFADDPTFSEEDDSKKNPYRASQKRYFDLLHTKLYISFDWENELVLGKAHLKATPLFFSQPEMTLDAKGFVFHQVALLPDTMPLEYDYNGKTITIALGKAYQKGEEVNLWIEYTSNPGEASGQGSSAITSDKGLFFINSRGTQKYKPTQIWTQGETEHNSRWFPTFDQPNERCTQEIYITVPDKFSTLSNGLLVSSVKNLDGTRTDYWKQDLPHAPYLFMMAIGEYAWVQEKWKDLDLYYIVEKEFEPYAKEIFNHTPEMLSFFSTLFGVEYPWSKYAQVVVRDYVSGAMENTTAVIFGEFVQKNNRDLIDNDNDRIVAHEMSHHWFGNLVTCESWSNLTLNEGFANYSEYLWYEYKYGKDRAEEHRFEEYLGYINSAYMQGMRPIVHFHFSDKEDMFDAHSYNKGGLVLHMLRQYLGDDAFFASLKYYLEKHAFTDVELAELRMAFEDVTGEDLNWFFDQWFLRKGHPMLEVTYEYDHSTSTQYIYLNQSQDETFILPVDVAIYDDSGHVQYIPTVVKNKKDTIAIYVSQKPAACVFDGKNTLLSILSESGKTDVDYFNQIKFSKNFLDRNRAIDNMDKDSEYFVQALKLLLNDPSAILRNKAIQLLPDREISELLPLIIEKTRSDHHSSVRSGALDRLFDLGHPEVKNLAIRQIEEDHAYSVVANALYKLGELDVEAGLKYALPLKSVKSEFLPDAVSKVLSYSDEPSHLEWFLQQTESRPTFSLFQIYDNFGKYLINLPNEEVLNTCKKLEIKARSKETDVYQKFLILNTISSVAYGKEEEYELTENPDTYLTIQSLQVMLMNIVESDETGFFKNYME